MRQIALLLFLTVVGNTGDFYYESGKKIEVIKLKEQRDSTGNITYYKNSNGHKIGVTHDILVQCKPAIDCQKLLSAYDGKVVKLSDAIFLFTIDNKKNVFEWSQKLYENENVKIAHPNFLKKRRRR